MRIQNVTAAHQINLDGLRKQSAVLSLMFFLQYMAHSTWLSFFNIFLEDKGFNGLQIGVITGLFQGTLFFIVPIWGILADKNGNKKVYQIALFFSSLLIFSVGYMSAFTIILVYMLFLSHFSHPTGSLLDSLAVSHVKNSQQSSFGELRVWGSIGWAVGTITMGRILINHETDVIFQTASILFFLTFLTTVTVFKCNRTDFTQNRFNLNHLMIIFKNRAVFWFLIILLFYGISVSPLYLFINLYFREIGTDNQTIGIAFAVQALSELPFFLFGSRFVRKIGVSNILVFSMLVAIIRLILYSYISTPSIAVILGITQGITFSMFWLAGIEYVHNFIPAQYRATGQSLIYAFHVGAGVTIGNVFNGWLYDLITMRGVMKVAALLCALVIIATLFYFRKWSKFFIDVRESKHTNIP